MPTINPATHCVQPDRHEPRLKCGHPLPCPHHLQDREIEPLDLHVGTPGDRENPPVVSARRRIVHGFLSRIAQTIDPTLLVTYRVRKSGGNGPAPDPHADPIEFDWQIERIKTYEVIYKLGESFADAHNAMRAWQAAQRAAANTTHGDIR